MIEFNGYLTGTAEKYFHKKVQSFGRKLLFIGMSLVLPLIISIASWTHRWGLILAYIGMYFAVPPLVSILRSEKEMVAMTPHKIFVQDEYIVCVADKYTEAKAISDVKVVRDFGEFYDIAFPFGNVSEKFVCQKSLLSKGTLEDFEALFEGKIERKQPC